MHLLAKNNNMKHLASEFDYTGSQEVAQTGYILIFHVSSIVNITITISYILRTKVHLLKS